MINWVFLLPLWKWTQLRTRHMLLKNNTLWVISDTSRLTCYSKTAAKIKSQRWPGPVSTFLAVHHCSQWVGGAADPAHLHCWAGTKPPQEQLLVHTLLIRREALMRMQGNSLHAELLLSKRLHHVIWCRCGTFWLKKIRVFTHWQWYY